MMNQTIRRVHPKLTPFLFRSWFITMGQTMPPAEDPLTVMPRANPLFWSKYRETGNGGTEEERHAAAEEKSLGEEELIVLGA